MMMSAKSELILTKDFMGKASFGSRAKTTVLE
jgi:hypothetical protein